ncbi:hypothetical protein [Algoriphagus sp. A40]|uniref:hypothetical protein n=1 Tax=Algoriphagus sp. A40 TaxID=1945863 RepID=UPI000986FA45|nr:hypothetical protein [Algoriphagus sp. A40]OOG70451.1 hypothetical protein B0E43_17735 [Algoriphagus sp. A40]
MAKSHIPKILNQFQMSNPSFPGFGWILIGLVSLAMVIAYFFFRYKPAGGRNTKTGVGFGIAPTPDSV